MAPTEQAIQEAFNLLDDNKDGTVDKVELANFINRLFPNALVWKSLIIYVNHHNNFQISCCF